MSRIAYSQKKNTVCLLTATALFLLVGILQYFDDFVSQRAVKEAMNLAACIILIGLAVVWAFCMYNRITPKRLQRSILLLAVFVVMLLVLRFIKYRFFKTNDIVMRHLWYAYYIPQTSIPALMLSAACYVGHDERKSSIGWLKWLSIPAVIMIVLIMTNDLHRLAFGFKPDLSNWESDYTHKLLYWINISWQLILSLISIVIIFLKCRIRQCKTRIWVLICGLAICVSLIVMSFFNVIHLYKTPELFCLFYVFILECSIQIGLIPSNSDYPRYFAASNISAMIMDNSGRVAFMSDKSDMMSKEFIGNAKNATVSADGSTAINVQSISGGKIVWTDDLTSINEINARIKEVQKNLSEENELILAENELKEQQSKITETQKIYGKIEDAVYRQVYEIEQLVSSTSASDSDYARKMIKVGVLGAYVKRRSNLTFIAEKEKR